MGEGTARTCSKKLESIQRNCVPSWQIQFKNDFAVDSPLLRMTYHGASIICEMRLNSPLIRIFVGSPSCSWSKAMGAIARKQKSTTKIGLGLSMNHWLKRFHNTLQESFQTGRFWIMVFIEARKKHTSWPWWLTHLEWCDLRLIPPPKRIYSRPIAGSDVVIATWTGSEKTECFLYPMLNHLNQKAARCKRQGKQSQRVIKHDSLSHECPCRGSNESLAQTPWKPKNGNKTDEERFR